MSEGLITALAKAQAEMKNAVFNKVNPHFKNRYADLTAIRDAVIPALTKHGIALVQTIEQSNNQTFVITQLLKDKEKLVSKCPVIMRKISPQAFGSALTYARRYSISALCCIVGDDDDDANLAENKPNTVRNSIAEAPDNIEKLLQKPPLVRGEKTKLKNLCREICADIMSCDDKDQIAILWNSHQKPLQKMQDNLPDFYDACLDAKNTKLGELQKDDWL